MRQIDSMTVKDGAREEKLCERKSERQERERDSESIPAGCNPI